MEKVVELTEKELDTMVQNKPRIDELHVGGEWLPGFKRAPRYPSRTLRLYLLELEPRLQLTQPLTVGLVKRNLLNSQEAGAKFSVTLTEKAPDNLKPSAQALEERRNKAFDKAVSVFANAQGGEDQADGEDDSD